jgi:hypothetical protein
MSSKTQCSIHDQHRAHHGNGKLQYRLHSAHLKLRSSRAPTTSRTVFGFRLSSRFATQRQQQSRALMAPNTREPVRFVSFVVHKPYSRRSPKSWVSVHLKKAPTKGITKLGEKKTLHCLQCLLCCGQFLYYSGQVLDTNFHQLGYLVVEVQYTFVIVHIPYKFVSYVVSWILGSLVNYLVGDWGNIRTRGDMFWSNLFKWNLYFIFCYVVV